MKCKLYFNVYVYDLLCYLFRLVTETADHCCHLLSGAGTKRLCH